MAEYTIGKPEEFPSDILTFSKLCGAKNIFKIINVLEYLSLAIICSSKLTVHFSEQIMSADKYSRIF